MFAVCVRERERERERKSRMGVEILMYWHQISKEYSKIQQTMSVWLVIWSTILATFLDYNLSIVIRDTIKNDVRHFFLTKRFKFSIIWTIKSFCYIWWYLRHWIYENVPLQPWCCAFTISNKPYFQFCDVMVLWCFLYSSMIR